MRSAAIAIAILAAGCDAKKAPRFEAGRDGEVSAARDSPAEPLPAGDPEGGLGPAGPARFIGAADDGSWVLVCDDAKPEPRLHVVIGGGAGLTADRVIATSDRDLIVADGERLVHVDAVAR